MLYISRWKIGAIITICILGIVFAIPNMLSPLTLEKFPSWLTSTINLGLELRGGSHLQLEVDLKAVQREQLSNMLDEVRGFLRKEKAGYTSLALIPNAQGISFMLRDVTQAPDLIRKLQKLLEDLEIQSPAEGRIEIMVSDQALVQRNRQIMEQSIEVIRRRIDETGTKEPLIQRQGIDRLIVQLPGVEDPAEVKRLIGRTAKLNFHLVDHEAGQIAVSAAGIPQGSVSAESEIVPEIRANGDTSYTVIKKQISISGENLVDARPTTNEYGQPAVSITFNNIGAKKFADISSKNIKRQFAMVLDGKIISAPVFQGAIPDGRASITGNFTQKEARDLALLLRAGSLPAPLKVIEERTVGPSLGADSIRDGQNATLFAFILVAIFMILNYSLFGLFADVALAFNLILLFAALSLLQATLTLPGIAGIALTIGMAVDANVLIYERIKEELRHGTKPAMAVDRGYSRALTTIIDSNLTTLIGAAVLYEFGTGPIRGFAVTLALGIIISLFSAISLTRLIIISWLRHRSIKTLPI